MVLVLDAVSSSASTAGAEYEYEYEKARDKADWGFGMLETRNFKRREPCAFDFQKSASTSGSLVRKSTFVVHVEIRTDAH
jgi:hypothetical protein